MDLFPGNVLKERERCQVARSHYFAQRNRFDTKISFWALHVDVALNMIEFVHGSLQFPPTRTKIRRFFFFCDERWPFCDAQQLDGYENPL